MLNEYLKYLNTIGSRYFIIAGIFFILFYVLLKNRKKAKKLQPQSPKKADYAREIGYSILTICIFAAAPILLLHVPSIAKHTTFYRDIQEHGRLYFFLAFPLMFIIHDAYFYWAHRLMHHKKLFKTFHL
ncbi:MAG: sterol desaturase, partial [Chitinophagaceae bacterium]